MTSDRSTGEELLGAVLDGRLGPDQVNQIDRLWSNPAERCWVAGMLIGLLASHPEAEVEDRAAHLLSARLAEVELLGVRMQTQIQEHIAALCAQLCAEDFEDTDSWSELCRQAALDYGIEIRPGMLPDPCKEDGAILGGLCLLCLLREGWSDRVEGCIRTLGDMPGWRWIATVVEDARLVRGLRSIIYPADLLDRLENMKPMERSRVLQVEASGRILQAAPELDQRARTISWRFRLPTARDPFAARLLLDGVGVGSLTVHRDADWNIRFENARGLFVQMLGGRYEGHVSYAMVAQKKWDSSGVIWHCDLQAGGQDLLLDIHWTEGG